MMHKKLLIISLVLFSISGIAFLFSKNSGDNDGADLPTVEQEVLTSTPNPTTAPIDQVATYQIEFVADWSASTHPNDYPANAHFSPFVAYSHEDNTEALILVESAPATPGIEEMAETGKTDILVGEIDELLTIGAAIEQITGNRIDSPGTDSGELKFDINHPNLTFVSMLAPSPDWFVAINNYSLIQDDEWIESVELTLLTYDAGTDSGVTFTSEDADTQPSEGITMFTDNLQELGKLIITRSE